MKATLMLKAADIPASLPLLMGKVSVSRNSNVFINMRLYSSRHELHSLSLNPIKPWLVAVGGAEGSVTVWDTRMGPQVTSAAAGQTPGQHGPVDVLVPEHLRARKHSISSVAYSYDGSRLLASFTGEQTRQSRFGAHGVDITITSLGMDQVTGSCCDRCMFSVHVSCLRVCC